jgi:hypothetical protein
MTFRQLAIAAAPATLLGMPASLFAQHIYFDEIMSSNADNSVAAFWASSNLHGTPGYVNSSFTVVAEKPDSVIPTIFSIAQNYPNPFNYTTTIDYNVMEATKVVIKVYDLLGREIETLTNANHQPGIYSLIFTANTLASGLYFYGIEMQDYLEVKKMMFIK